MSDRRVRMGGLMRCCLGSIAAYDGPEVPGETTIGCLYESDPNKPVALLAEDGVWEWIVPKP